MALTTNNRDRISHRLLIPLLQTFLWPGEVTQLKIGDDLPALPIELPVPSPSVLRWSLMTPPQYFMFFFEIAGLCSQIQSAYLKQLQTSGWYIPSLEHFIPSTTTGLVCTITYKSYDGPDADWPAPLAFCKQGYNAELSVDFFQPNPRTTQLKLELILGRSYSACNSQLKKLAKKLVFPKQGLKRFRKPVLAPPEEAQLEWMWNEGSDDTPEQQMCLSTPLSLIALANHYVAQMRQQGWAMHTSSGDDLLQWSLWSRTDILGSSQQGILSLWVTDQPDLYMGIFRVTQERLPDGFSAATAAIESGTVSKSTAIRLLKAARQIPDREWVELWIDQLPSLLSAQLSTSLASLDEVTILGGFSQADEARAVLETTVHPQTIRALYRNTLLITADWKQPENWNITKRMGFQPAGLREDPPDIFCHLTEATEIMVSMAPTDEGATRIWISLYNRGDTSPCRVSNRQRLKQKLTCNGMPIEEVPLSDSYQPPPILRLLAPPETTVFSMGASWGNSRIRSTSYLQSRLSTQDLVAHYADQMRQFGWQQYTVTFAGRSSFSLWHFEADIGTTWQGILGFIAQPETDQWTGYFKAASENIYNVLFE